MYQSKISISKRTKKQNIDRIEIYLKKIKKCRCGILRRNISLKKFSEANKQRNAKRLETFFVALDILKKSKKVIRKTKKGFLCFEIKGESKEGKLILIHLREETNKNNKILYFISSFYGKKKNPLL